MPGRDNELWQQCWRDRASDFHALAVNPLLQQFWSGLQLKHASRVFVPLCGKSLDLLWLVQQGHSVIGVELSPLAVRAFFRENHLQPARRKLGAFTLWEHGQLAILCGDFFRLSAVDLGEIDAVYDRAALTALPEDLRILYLKHLEAILPASCKMLLLTTDEAETGEGETEALAVADEITSLYAARFEIVLEHVAPAVDISAISESNPQGLIAHKVYRLMPQGC